MQIYFSASAHTSSVGHRLQRDIVRLLRAYGEVRTEVSEPGIVSSYERPDLSPQQIHDRDVEWLLSSDVLVADVSAASLGVGYEIGRFVERTGKPVLALLPAGSDLAPISAMIVGSPSIQLRAFRDVADLSDVFKTFFTVSFPSNSVDAL